MLNDIEKYLKEKRNQLDSDKPDQTAIWEGIRKELERNDFSNRDRNRKLSEIRKWNIAALIILIFGFSYIFFSINMDSPTDYKVHLSSFDESLGQREKEYKEYILIKEQEANAEAFLNDPIINEIHSEILHLDTLYNQSMKDMDEIGYNEKIIHTIFDIYEQKIFLLKLMILETNKMKSHENNKNKHLL